MAYMNQERKAKISQGLEAGALVNSSLLIRNSFLFPFLLAGSPGSSYTISIIRTPASLDRKAGRTGDKTPRVGDGGVPRCWSL